MAVDSRVMGKRLLGLTAIGAALGCHPNTVRRRFLRYGWPPLIKVLYRSQWRWELDWDVYAAMTVQRSAALRATMLKASPKKAAEALPLEDVTLRDKGEG